MSHKVNDPRAHDVQIVKVFGDKHAREKNLVPAFERHVHKREMRFNCAHCNLEVSEWHYPGPLLKYCSSCSPVVQAEKTRARAAKQRQRLKEAKVH